MPDAVTDLESQARAAYMQAEIAAVGKARAHMVAGWHEIAQSVRDAWLAKAAESRDHAATPEQAKNAKPSKRKGE